MTRNRITTLALACSFTLAACDDDPVRPDGGADARDYGVVLNSTGLTLTVFPTEAPDSTVTIPLGADGTPSSLAVRDSFALVPLGVFPAVAVVDLDQGEVLHVIALPAGSGATGVAIVDDSLAFVANPELNTVSPVRYRDGVALDAIDVGVYPTALVAHDGRVYVLEANLVDFVPDGPSTVSVIDAGTLEVDADFTLSGRNAGDALVSGDTVLYVLNRGDFGSDNGSVSVVRLPVAAESEHFDGFGAGTGTIAELEDGDLLVSSFVYGLAQFDARAEEFVTSPDVGAFPTGAENILAAAVDADGRLYAIDARDCAQPGAVYVWEGTLADIGSAQPVTVGSCPLDLEFGTW